MVIQISLALMLLIASGLLVRSLVRLLAVDPGLETRHLVAAQVFAYDRNETAAKRIAFFAETIARIQTLPGVETVGAASTVPFVRADINIEGPLTIVGRPPANDAEAPSVFLTSATPGYFRAAGIPLRRGRIFDEDATLTARIVAVINDTLARRYFFGEEPIGRLIEVVDHGRRKQAEIIGVVGDLRYGGLDGQAASRSVPAAPAVAAGGMTYVVRTTVDPASMIASIKQRVWSVDPLQTFYDAGAVDGHDPGVVASPRAARCGSCSCSRPWASCSRWRAPTALSRRSSGAVLPSSASAWPWAQPGRISGG